MKADPIRGQSIQWTFTDGPMANRSFEHSFHEDGSLEFRMLGGKAEGKPTQVRKYEVATVGADVHAVSYLGPSGFVLTVVLDFRSGKLVAFASNEKELSLQHGSFSAGAAAKAGASPAPAGAPSLR